MPPPLDLETTAGLPFDVSLSLLLLPFSFPPGLEGLWSQSVFPRLVEGTYFAAMLNINLLLLP